MFGIFGDIQVLLSDARRKCSKKKPKKLTLYCWQMVIAPRRRSDVLRLELLPGLLLRDGDLIREQGDALSDGLRTWRKDHHAFMADI